MSAKPQTWLITGATSGLGYSLAAAALAAGHTVIGTGRSASRQPAALVEKGLRWLTLDVTSPTLEADLAPVASTVDVLVNNAGYATAGPLERTTLEQVRAQFDTNFFGALRCIQAVLPHMRERRSGVILNISSAVALGGMPGVAIYGASKIALEGLSESLREEVKEFGIKVLVASPGSMKAKLSEVGDGAAKAAGASGGVLVELGKEYEGTAVDAVMKGVMSVPDEQCTDTYKTAEEIFSVVKRACEGGEEGGLRFILGPQAGWALDARIADYQGTKADLEKGWGKINI